VEEPAGLRTVLRMDRLLRTSFLLYVGLTLAACGSNAPSAPSPTPPASTKALQIVGTTVLNPGATSQLSARNLDGSAATGVTWTSLTPTVATVTGDGLLTAVAEGTSTIRASAPGAIGSVGVQVHAAGSTVSLVTCTNLTSPGEYVVAADMPSISPCFSISNVAQVHLDCQHHSMAAIVVSTAQSVTIENCVVNANVRIMNASDVTVRHSTINSGILWASTSSNVLFDANTAISGGTGLGGLVVFQDGTNNRATNNVLDGAYNGGAANVGVDDGVILENESGDAIENNTIRNVFDAGIEGVAGLSSTSISGNTISSAGVAGVASYWCTDWTGNTIQGNTVTQSPVLARIYYTTGSKCGSTITPAAFSGNTFIGNVFRTPIAGTQPEFVTRMSINMVGPVQNNLIKTNDFGSDLGPWLQPAGGYVDGGGNLCGQRNPNETTVLCGPGTASGHLIAKRAR
jgi:hypothetical protein